ncbi:GNAT family N-acetyltransferase [Chitinophaga sp.]|uniref:GNAT family N-acetyltransferase n=1 Tax=Chitinophaga sp. TaxID=1869181 RepID=UPI0031E10700
MIIRPYLPADKAACLEAFESNMPRFFAPDELADYAGWLDELAVRENNEITNGAEHYYVMEENGAITGCGGFSVNLQKQEAFMAWGFITNALHKKGLGKALFLYRLHKIREICPACTIILDTTQHSYPFFEKLGFHTVRITKDSYGPGLDRYDMMLRPGQ